MFLVVVVISISSILLYVYNWVHGTIIFSLICIFCEIFIILSPIPILQKLIYCASLFCIFLVFVLSVRLFEYLQRESFFLQHLATQQKDNTISILKSLPDPLVISEKGQVTFINDSLLKVPDLSNAVNEAVHGDLKAENLKVKSTEEILSKIVNEQESIPLISIISQSKTIETPKIFNYIDPNFKKKFPFEIISKEIEVGENVDIVYSFKNLTYYKKLQKAQSKKKYSRLTITSLTHNLKTPINMIKGSSELLIQ